MSLHVVIVGAGLGGLALAHGLRKVGVGVTVYEREPAPDSRPQGYRIHIDAEGHAALAECLPPDLYELYVATSTRPPRRQRAVFLDHHLTETGSGDARVGEAAPERAPTAVDRLTLREILLTRLEGVVRFGREVRDYERTPRGVLVRFADGTAAEGDVLVAADGIRSPIRRRLLPHARVHDTGVRAIIGKTPLGMLDGGLPEIVDTSFTGVHGPGFRTLAMAVYRSRRDHAEAAGALAPDAALSGASDYLMWLQLARVADYPLSDERLFSQGQRGLHRLALEMLEGWHPLLRGLVEPAPVASVFATSIRAVLPVAEWPAGNVTLLGDAIHAMAPIGGRGANTALCDAARLTDRLAAVDRGESAVREAIGEYESRMREYGSSAVVESLRRAGPSIGARSPYAASPAPS